VTLPDERTRAIIYVRDFLVRLSSPYVKDGLKKVPMPVRAEARRLLKHYPHWVDLLRPESALDAKAAQAHGDWLDQLEKEAESGR
jgi:hypothetical protein